MKILGDNQILLFHELFGSLGETATYSGRDVSAVQLADVDALITRSTLKVDKALLAQSSLAFAGTCTIGFDHYDTHHLEQQGIKWTNAAGCNARAVVQYVLSAMAQLKPDWLNATVGIIGCGNIGGQVYRCLRALGVQCRVYDPLLSLDKVPVEQKESLQKDMTTLEEVLAADIVTSHAPLTKEGEHPSYHLLGRNELAQLRPNTLLISAGRGAVIDNQALVSLLAHHKQIRVVMDVWENEPEVLIDLVPLVDIATPHIAGYSLEGKENGTVMVYQALCKFLQSQQLGQPITAIDPSDVVNTETTSVDLHTVVNPVSDQATALNQWLLMAYPIMDDDQRFRQYANNNMAKHFDALRKNYPIRREYPHFQLSSESQSHPHYSFIVSAIESLTSC